VVKPRNVTLRTNSAAKPFGLRDDAVCHSPMFRTHRTKICTTGLTTLGLQSRSLMMKPFLLAVRQPGRGRQSTHRLPGLLILGIGVFLFCGDQVVPSATGASDFSPLPKDSAVNLTNSIILVSPKVLDFGSVTMGKSVTDTVLVENVGGGKLVGRASVSAPFKIISGGDYSLKEKQIQVVTVAYTPARTGAVSGKVTFTGGGGTKATVTGNAVSAHE
jgi:hypothetical protein